MNKTKIKKFLMYAFRWQCSTPIIALCIWLLPLNPLIQTIIANFIGSCIFFEVDRYIFKDKKLKGV